MKRIHLFELEDQSWLPNTVRNSVTDYLRFLWATFGIYDAAVPKIERAMRQAQTTHILDLCSGASGPWAQLLPRFADHSVTVTLSDKHPNTEAFARVAAEAKGQVDYISKSVDATRVPPDVQGVRTIFSGFHHFEPALAKAILKDAVEHGTPICIFEMTGRRRRNVMLTLVFGPLTMLLMTPFIKPFRVSRIAWTYILPIVPLVYTWDGVVSHLRTYSCDELMVMIEAINSDDYHWEVGELPAAFFPVTYLTGYPMPAQ